MSEQELEITVAPSFPYEVWNTLSRIDVSGFVETKGDKYKLSYLSWTFAWAALMSHFPESAFLVKEEEVGTDGTMMVNVLVTVAQDQNRLTREMWLPVMDHTNKSIVSPSTRQISDARMRCLVKCLSLFGLGLDVYAGSDRPMGTFDDPLSEEHREILVGLLEAADQDMDRFYKWMKITSLDEMPDVRFNEVRIYLEKKIRGAK